MFLQPAWYEDPGQENGFSLTSLGRLKLLVVSIPGCRAQLFLEHPENVTMVVCGTKQTMQRERFSHINHVFVLGKTQVFDGLMVAPGSLGLPTPKFARWNPLRETRCCAEPPTSAFTFVDRMHYTP